MKNNALITFNIWPFCLTSLVCKLLLVLLYSLSSLQSVYSQNLTVESIPFDKISTGSLYFKQGEQYSPAITQQSDYQVNVNGLLATVNFSQTFHNSSNEFLEAVYVFPLIDDASVSSMVMEIGERRIVGKIREKEQAKQLYTQAKQAGKKASLVSQQRPNLFTTKLANIAPGETIKISLSYLQSITLNDETFSLRIPLTLTPRYIPTEQYPNTNETAYSAEPAVKSEQVHKTKIQSNGWATNNARVPDASEITPFQTRLSINPLSKNFSNQQSVTLAVTIDGSLPLEKITSLYHQILDNKTGNKHLISLKNTSVRLDQDFVLQWQLAQGQTPKVAFFTQRDPINESNQYQYGLLMVMPPKSINEKTIKKDVIYIIDTSGSMGGVAIKQAKQSLIQGLGFLSPNDTFNILAFNTNTRPLFAMNKSASEDNLEYAKQWLSTLQAGGGTNMAPAIKQAFQYPMKRETYRQVVFITDGSVGNEAELFSLIDKELGSTRLHTVGIGSAPNGYFMTEAARVGRGTYRYIGSINEVNEQMTQLFSQISKPLMRNIELTWPTTQVEIFPKKIPDLYANQPLLISTRWLTTDTKQRHVDAMIKITGQLADSAWEEYIDIADQNNLLNDTLKDNGVAKWWAKNKIDDLITAHRRSPLQEKPEFQFQITQLALQHQLLSPYTSFLAIEEKISRDKNQTLETEAIKNLMPKGSTQSIPLANTALGIMKYFYMGLFFLVISIFMHLIKRKRV